MSNYFTRVFDRAQIREVQKMLESVSGRKHPINLSESTFTIKAPDGDVVFAGMRKSSNSRFFICRLHKEVFNPA